MMWQRWWRILRLRLRSLARRPAVERELDKELLFHFERQVEENLALGMPPEAARRAALGSLDGLTIVKEECRDMRRTQYFENLRQDLRYSLRTLLASPGFTAVIVLTLALSIGANSAIFSVVDGVLLKPLPYPQPDRIVRVFFSNASYPKFRLNPFDFRDFRARNRSFASLAAFTRRDLQLSGAGDPERIPAMVTTAGYFAVLGLEPARGREFGPADELPNVRVVILSDRLWRRRFAADPAILGKAAIFDALPYTVVGVMPAGAEHPGNDHNPLPQGETVDAWIPFAFAGNASARGSHYLDGIGRLNPGVAPAQAERELSLITAQIARELPKYAPMKWRVLVIPLYQEIVGKSQLLLLVLLGAVGAVLLIACVNAANLLLARSTVRRHEFAVRAALGAGRGRLLQQTLTESLFLALAGACGGAAVAVGGVKLLVWLLPADFPRAHSIQLNAAVFGFTLVVALATGVLFGIAPAFAAANTHPNLALRDGSRGATAGRRHLHLRGVFVVAEVAMACALLVGAGLMLRSFVNLLRADPGFRPEHVLTAAVSLPAAQYKDGPAISRFYDLLVTGLAGLSGVQAAGAGTDIPWTGYNENTTFDIEGRTPDPDNRIHARYHGATADYFRALGIPLAAGRFFNQRDTAAVPQVVMINQSLARKYWPHESAVGKRISFNTPPDWVTVIGVVGDVKDAPASASAEPAFWWPELQVQPTLAMTLVVRSASDPGMLLAQVRQEVRRLNASLALSDVRTMDDVASRAVATPRFSLFLVALFAALALSLAAIGMYGVVAYSVGQRTHEFGLRMALGARPRDVQRLVLAQGAGLALVGAALGMAGALLLGKWLRSLLFEIAPADPATFAAVGAVALLAAGLACYLPARRATEVDPMKALRCD